MSATKHSTDHLLRLYLNGAITAPEEAELERRAQTDESLAEAIRGVRAFPEEDHAARVARMLAGARSQLQRKAVAPPLRRRLTRWAAAAAILLLLGSAIFFLPRLTNSGTRDLAMENKSIVAPKVDTQGKKPAPEASSAVVEVADDAPTAAPTLPSPASSAPAAAPSPTATDQGRKSMEAIRQQSNNDARARLATGKREQDEAAAKRAAPPQEELTMEVEAEDFTPEASAIIPPPPPPTAPISQASISPPEPVTARADDFSRVFSADFINGLVTNENGVPINGALIRLPGQPIGEMTDSLGTFRIPTMGVARLIEVTHPDYDAEEVELSQRGNDVQISLDRKPFQKKQPNIYTPAAGATIITWSPQPGYAKPEEGYSNLRQRIEDSPPEGLTPGKYKFSFLVNTDGTLTDFEFRGRPDRAVMDYIGETMARTSAWRITDGEEPVRVYFKVEW